MSTALKLFLLICVAFAFSCNSNNNNDKPAENKKRGTLLPADSMSREALFVFIADCVDGASKTHGEAEAFALCKCMYEQLRKDNEGIDSTQMQSLQRDTASVRKMLDNCR